MKERPIIFNAPMVKAILEGRKTQTRRIAKNLPVHLYGVKCPYGQPGDRLWVRENWKVGAWDENNGRIAIDYCDGPDKRWRTDPSDTDGEKFEKLWIQISDELIKKGIQYGEDGRYKWNIGESPLNWKPSIFMPRWASRINLEIVDVRVERLQDITEEDAIAEGVSFGHITDQATGEIDCEATDAYEVLWESIYGHDSWDKNPWVWVVEFKRVES